MELRGMKSVGVCFIDPYARSRTCQNSEGYPRSFMLLETETQLIRANPKS